MALITPILMVPSFAPLVVVNFPPDAAVPDAAVPEAAVPDAAAPAAVEAAAVLCTLCCALEEPHPVRVMVITAAAVIMDSTFDELVKPFLCILLIIFPPLSSAVRSGHDAGLTLYIKKRQGSLRLPYRLFTDMNFKNRCRRLFCLA
jgi:hypothetical protein